MLLRPGGQPQPWDIDAAATTSMGHRCGCAARLSSIDGPSFGCGHGGWRRSARRAGSRDLNGGHREPGAERAGTGPPATALPHLTPLPSRYICQIQPTSHYGVPGYRLAGHDHQCLPVRCLRSDQQEQTLHTRRSEATGERYRPVPELTQREGPDEGRDY